MVNQIVAGVGLLGYLLIAISFGYFLVKMAESEIPSIIATRMTTAIKNIAHNSHYQGKYPQWLKYAVYNAIRFYTGIEERLQIWIENPNPVKKRNSQECPRNPECSLNFRQEDISQQSHKGIIAKVKSRKHPNKTTW